MNYLLVVLMMSMLPLFTLAASLTYPLDSIQPDLDNQASLQRGLRTYMNYCIGCHALQYQRYQRTANDLGIPKDLMLKHLIFDANNRIGDPITNNLSVENAKAFFGAVPPDLTLHSNLKSGPDWIYTYLRTFYEDESRPFGFNNLVFKDVGMPHILVGLQGRQIRSKCLPVPKLAANGGVIRDPMTDNVVMEEKCGDAIIEAGHYPLQHIPGTGSLTAAEYDELSYDLANFMYYVGEPTRIERTRIGVYVLLFLAFFYVFTWLLGREYHKEFHKS